MKIAIIGYGKMGKEIEQAALPNHNISAIIDLDNFNEISNLNKYNTDVAIEFTTPTAAVNNIVTCFKQGIPVVCGTTGWYDKLDYVKKLCNEFNGTLFYAPNFSIGVNLYFNMLKSAMQTIKNQIHHYKLMIEEIHHTQKKDSPSGTALAIANIIMKEIDEIKGWKNFLNTDPETKTIDTIPIVSKRIEYVVGTHKVYAKSEVDEIIIEHKAISRKGFALGAISAAEFIIDKKGIFTMDDLLNFKI